MNIRRSDVTCRPIDVFNISFPALPPRALAQQLNA